jgi:hypothetical protein
MAKTLEICETSPGSSPQSGAHVEEEEKIDKDLNPPNVADDVQYPQGLALILILTSVFMAMFLVALVSIMILRNSPFSEAWKSCYIMKNKYTDGCQ